MIGKKQILVACGTAIATSTVVAKALEEALKERHILADIRQCRASEVPGLADSADLIVTTTPVQVPSGKPVVETLAFITGIGKDAVLERIISLLTA